MKQEPKTAVVPHLIRRSRAGAEEFKESKKQQLRPRQTWDAKTKTWKKGF
jgi:hypothetical protein